MEKLFIKEAISKEDEKEKEALTYAIANLMKKLFITWNKEFVEDEVIFSHLEELSNGKLMPNKEKALTSVEELAKSIPKVKPVLNKKKGGKKTNQRRHSKK
jgi:hypothetical protein